MDESYLGYRILLLIFIIACNAFFASAEVSLISARQSRLRELAAAGNVGAQAAINLLARPERLLSTVQVGVTLAGLGLGWAGEDTVYRALMTAFHPWITPQTEAIAGGVSFVIAFLLLTFFMVVLGEVVPKNVGIKKAEGFSVVAAPLLLVFYRVSQPFIYVLERASSAVSRLLGLRAEESQGAHSVEELKLIASSVRAGGRMTAFQESAVRHVLDLPAVSVREVMAPRHDMVSIPVDASLDHVLRVLIESQYTRVPVYERTPEQIVGFLHYKDLLPVWQRMRSAERLKMPGPVFHLRPLLRKLLVVPESKPLDQMVDEFRHNHAHMAMVVDEFGTITGLVTFEDVLEQVFGEIEDEHDAHRPRPSLTSPLIELEGTASIRDLESQYGIALPPNAGFETLAGFLLFRFGYIPQAGEWLEYEGRRFTILEMDNKRIARVRIER
ncbi:MAG: hemolysin family protein [Acidobacteriota bacterium]